MPIGGKIRERKDFSKVVGLMEVKVLAINPDKEELEKLLDTQLEKDPEYLGEYQEKDEAGEPVGLPKTRFTVTIWVENVKTKLKYPIRISLIDKVRVSKKGIPQYINTLGQTTWADSEENLPTWFAKRESRQAKIGEEELYSFMRNWLGNLDYKDADTNLLSEDWKKLMRGNVKEFRDLIGTDATTTVVVMATVRTVEKEGDINEYQDIYNKDFLPGYTIKFFRANKFTEEKIEQLREREKAIKDTPEGEKKVYLKPFEKFILKVSDSEYGTKDAYFLGEAKEYVAEEHIQGSNKVIDNTDASY